MKNFKLGFDHDTMEISVADNRLISELVPNKVEYDLTNEEEVKRSLSNPIGKDKLSILAKGKKNVVIITSDITRPCPSKKIIPAIIDELHKGGIENNQITIVFALGSHRHHTKEEQIYLVGEEVYNNIKCVDSDPNDCIHLGNTKIGTPIDIFSVVAKADFKICVGNIEYHYFAGYSGGAKAIMPGVSTPSAIQVNHKLMISDGAYSGNINSPVRIDVEEAAKTVGIDYIVNVVLDEHKNIIKCVSGDYILAHREGCKFLDSFYKIKLKEKADIVIVSAGGFPKDQNMYQAQKALDNSKHAVKDGGIIIWVASCKDGFGNATFEQWMKSKLPQQRVDDIHKEFKLGGHKAAYISLVQQKAKIFLVSSLNDDLVKQISLTPFKDINSAFIKASEIKGKDSSVIVMPYGGSTLPVND